MTKIYLRILSIITIFAVNGIKSDDTIEALRKILKELNAPIEDRYDEVNHNPTIYQPRHFNHARPKHRGGPNLMNVQTMNLFLKPNKRQLEEAGVNRFLRKDAENLCKAGRCGCTGTRCGNNREDDLADEVDRVVNEINKQLAIDNDENRNDRDRVNLDDELDEENRNEVTNRADEDDRIKKVDVYERNDDIDDLLHAKRIKVNDNLDVIILDKSDLDVLLRNKDFVDLTRNDVNKDDEDQDEFDIVLEEYKKPIAAEDKAHHRSTNIITPEDFLEHYESIKQEEVAKVFGYVKDEKPSTVIQLKRLTPFQRNKLRSINLKYKRGELKDDALEEAIVKILFGDQSNMKIVAQTENNNRIYVPQWMYNKMMSFQKSLNDNSLRVLKTEKRILPLTSQQKGRLANKEKGINIPKLVWRKNMGQDVERFGIPFDFEVHGLGQMAA